MPKAPPDLRVFTVSMASAMRRGCRVGLVGLRMRWFPPAWKIPEERGPLDVVCERVPLDHLSSMPGIFVMRARSAGGIIYVPSHECILLEDWPVVCCRPRFPDLPPERKGADHAAT